AGVLRGHPRDRRRCRRGRRGLAACAGRARQELVNLLGLRMPRWARRGGSIPAKSRGELEAMRAAGLIVSRTLAAVTEAAKPGVSTLELDALAEQLIRDADAVPSFKGYHGFPGSICASVNDQIVHGIPSAELVLADGDLLSVDCGAILEGWHGDSAVTI